MYRDSPPLPNSALANPSLAHQAAPPVAEPRRPAGEHALSFAELLAEAEAVRDRIELSPAAQQAALLNQAAARTGRGGAAAGARLLPTVQQLAVTVGLQRAWQSGVALLSRRPRSATFADKLSAGYLASGKMQPRGSRQ